MKQEMQTNKKKKNGVHEQKRRRRWLRLDLERMHLRQQKADGETHEADETLFFPPSFECHAALSVLPTEKRIHANTGKHTHVHTHTPIYMNIHTRTYTLKHSLSFASLYVYQKGHEGALSPPFIGEKKN